MLFGGDVSARCSSRTIHRYPFAIVRFPHAKRTTNFSFCGTPFILDVKNASIVTDEQERSRDRGRADQKRVPDENCWSILPGGDCRGSFRIGGRKGDVFLNDSPADAPDRADAIPSLGTARSRRDRPWPALSDANQHRQARKFLKQGEWLPKILTKSILFEDADRPTDAPSLLPGFRGFPIPTNPDDFVDCGTAENQNSPSGEFYADHRIPRLHAPPPHSSVPPFAGSMTARLAHDRIP